MTRDLAGPRFFADFFAAFFLPDFLFFVAMIVSVSPGTGFIITRERTADA